MKTYEITNSYGWTDSTRTPYHNELMKKQSLHDSEHYVER